MGLSCIIGHKWNGCKCERCGKTQHQWNGCKCTKCGEIQDKDHQWKLDTETFQDHNI